MSRMSPASTRSAPRSNGVYGPLSAQALASAIFGLYAGLVYLTPILGGFIADRLLGGRRTIIVGALADGRRPFPDGVRGQLPDRLALPPARRRLLQGQYRDPGRRALQARTSSRRADAFQIFLLSVNIARHRRSARLRHARARRWLALGLRRRRSRDADRARRLSLGPALAAGAGGRRRATPAKAPSARRSSLATAQGFWCSSCCCRLLTLSAVGNQQIFNCLSGLGRCTFRPRLLRPVDAGHLAGLARCLHLDSGDLAVASCSGAGGRSGGREPNEITKLTIGVADFGAGAARPRSWPRGRRRRPVHKIGLVWGFAFHVINSYRLRQRVPGRHSRFIRAPRRAPSPGR